MIINLLVIGFTLFGVKEILFKHNGIESSLHWIIMAFVLGYRTFEPIQGIRVHPIEILVYATIIRIIISGAIKYRKIPVAVSLISIFCVTFFLIDGLTRYSPFVLNEFKNAFLMILIFFITQHIHFSKSYFVRLLKHYLLASSLISIMGILEFMFPLFISSIFGFQNQAINTSENILFTRLAFLFWGSHLAANLIPPAFLILILLKTEKDPIIKNNYVLTFLVIINLVAIYLSGNRISWLILTIFLIATISHYRGSLLPYMKSYVMLVTLTFVAYVYSQPVEGRYISTFKALTGQIDTRFDSSGIARMARAKIAIDSIIKKPLGTGWGSQGWVHSDMLQLAATIGVIPAVILLIGLLFFLVRTYRIFLLAPPNEQTIFFVCCGFLVFVIISLSLNGNIILVQSGMPLFLFWAIVDGYLNSHKQLESY
jgi:hypothetical protein